MEGDARPTQPTSTGRILLFSCFLVTGATSLVFEVVWTRFLLLSIGATAVAVGAVLGAFMGGMAVGAFLAGRRWVARLDPILTYAFLEGWAGIYGLATPFLLRLAETQAPAVQLASAVLLLLPATVGMGASLPVLTRALRRSGSRLAADVGRLYAANTAGAVLGPLAAVFWFFPPLGLLRTLHVASGLDVLVCVLVVASRARLFPAFGPLAPETDRETRPRLGDGLLLLALSVSGAVAMVYEVAWTRVLSIAFASSIYAVTIMLSAFLAGIAGGSAFASAVLGRSRRPASYGAVAGLLAGTAVGAYVSLPVGSLLPRLFVALQPVDPGRDAGQFAAQFLVAALLMLPTALCLGALLPVAASVPLRDSQQWEPGERISRLYTANLVGSATGAVLASAVLLGSYGVSLTVRMASATAIAAAIAILVRTSTVSLVRGAVAATTAVVVLAISPGAEAVARGIGFYSGMTAYKKLSSRELRGVIDAHRMLYYRDGPTATVAVHEVAGFRVMMINGKTDASTGPGDMQTQLLVAHLPLMARAARRVAVVGWGSGITTGAVLTYPVEELDAFEIEPAVVEGSSHFDDVSGAPLEDPRLTLQIGDARALLRRSPKKYDVIISQPSNPWLTGIANLFTEEYFRILDARLSPDGVVCQWFHTYGMSEEATRSVVATFARVFPEQLLFQIAGGRDVLLLGSRQPIRFDLPTMRRVFEDPIREEALSAIGLQYPFDLLVGLSLDTAGAARFAAGAPLNTDDNMRLELLAPRTLYADHIAVIGAALSRYPPAIIDHVDGYRSESEVALEEAASLFTSGHHERALARCEQALALEPSFAGYKLRGQILQAMGREEDARKAYEFALSLGGEAEEVAFVRALLRTMGYASDEEG